MADDEKKKSRMKVEVIETEAEGKETEINSSPNTENEEVSIEESVKTDEANNSRVEKEEVREERSESVDIKKHKVNRSDKIPFWILFFAFVVGLTLGAGLVGGIFYYRTNVENVFDGILPSPTPSESTTLTEPENTPTEAPKQEIKLDSYKVSILNGSGIKGEAGKVQGLLASTGFTEITTGNASSYNFKATEVSLKEGVPDGVFNKIEESLKTYEIEKTDNLPSSSKFDVVITVGSTKL